MIRGFFLILAFGGLLFASDIELNAGVETDAPAAYELAKKYERERNIDEAMFWYKRAAELALSNQANISTRAYNRFVKPTEINSSKRLELTLSSKAEFSQENATIDNRTFFEKYIDDDDDETQNTIFQLLSSTFGIFPYRANYLLPFTYDLRSHDGRDHFETVFQLSIAKDFITDFFGFGESFGFAYTQRSWWQTAEDSSPFRETNYQPEIYLVLPNQDNSSILKSYRFGFLHESNGQEIATSRSWNRIYASVILQYKRFFIQPRVWYRIPEHTADDDNPDIHKYLGYGDLAIIYPHKDHLFKVLLRNNLDFTNNRGAVQVDWSFPIWDSGLFGYIQLFNGYGESLIDYNERTRRIGIGFALSR